jgi:hypothetical protein
MRPAFLRDSASDRRPYRERGGRAPIVSVQAASKKSVVALTLPRPRAASSSGLPPAIKPSTILEAHTPSISAPIFARFSFPWN